MDGFADCSRTASKLRASKLNGKRRVTGKREIPPLPPGNTAFGEPPPRPLREETDQCWVVELALLPPADARNPKFAFFGLSQGQHCEGTTRNGVRSG